jgi:hypothetical protein
MIVRLFLALVALLFISYGLYCLVAPESLSGGAGLVANSITGTIELQTMYGGLQTSVGVLCLLAVFNRAYEQFALVALVFVFAGLAVPRVSLALMHGDFSGYTVFAMTFEALSLLFLLWVLRRPAKS